jgi:hypothetical protein
LFGDWAQVGTLVRPARAATIHKVAQGRAGHPQAPYVIAIVDEVGYGLCELAEKARGASTRGNGSAEIALPELGRNVRRLRAAVGLNSNGTWEALRHRPRLPQRLGKRPTESHGTDAWAPGEKPRSVAGRFLERLGATLAGRAPLPASLLHFSKAARQVDRSIRDFARSN